MLGIIFGIIGFCLSVVLRRSSSKADKKYADYIAILSCGVIAGSITLISI